MKNKECNKLEQKKRKKNPSENQEFMEKRPGHGKRVQNNPKNSHVNNRINTTKVTVICRKNNTEENYKNIGNEGASPSRDTAFLLCCCASKAGTGKAAQVQQAMVLSFSLAPVNVLHLSLTFTAGEPMALQARNRDGLVRGLVRNFK